MESPPVSGCGRASRTRWRPRRAGPRRTPRYAPQAYGWSPPLLRKPRTSGRHPSERILQSRPAARFRRKRGARSHLPSGSVDELKSLESCPTPTPVISARWLLPLARWFAPRPAAMVSMPALCSICSGGLVVEDTPGITSEGRNNRRSATPGVDGTSAPAAQIGTSRTTVRFPP
jgi:hypothetical protein